MQNQQELSTNKAFSNQSKIFDELDKQNPILQWMRTQIRAHVLTVVKPTNTLLELNAGTGLDAVFFANNGINVVATDNAAGMITEIKKKIIATNLAKNLTVQNCSFNDLSTLKTQTFDAIFSNFGGLNCAENLDNVIKQFDDLLTQNGTATLVIMPPVCPWEIALALKGNFKIAFRRFKKQGAISHLEGVYFNTNYYTPNYVRKAFGKKYKMIALIGLGIISPPPYLENFAIKYPKIYTILTSIDNKINKIPLIRSCGDHYLITMQKL